MSEKYCILPKNICDYGSTIKKECENCELNKRFAKRTIDNWETYIVDRLTGKEYGYDVGKMLNLLNSLDEEMEEKIRLFDKEISACYDTIHELETEKDNLKKENHHLAHLLAEATRQGFQPDCGGVLK